MLLEPSLSKLRQTRLTFEIIRAILLTYIKCAKKYEKSEINDKTVTPLNYCKKELYLDFERSERSEMPSEKLRYLC